MATSKTNNTSSVQGVGSSKVLTPWQQNEFEQVLSQQKAIAKQLKAKNFEPSIEVKLKLKPKFSLMQHGELKTFDRHTKHLAPKSYPETKSVCQVSLVVPVYNRARYLAQTLDSILAQTHTNFELIVWDDGSTDDSLAIAIKYAKNDSRIQVFSGNNVGQPTAMVKAIAKTKGKYIGSIDSDDLLHPEALAKTVAVLESDPRIGMVYTDHWVMDAKGRVKGVGKRCFIPFSPERLLVDFMTFHFRLMRRSVYDGIGGIDASFGSAEDYDLCLRFSEATEIEHLTQPLYYYRWHGDNLSTTQQLTQTKYSMLAVNRALSRRGLEEKLRLQVRLNPSYRLQRGSKVANKVFGIGLSKTGTTSLNSALNLLGIPSIHLPRSLLRVKEFDGATDIPIVMAYQKLDELYPGSKFILTIRHLRQWLYSYQLHQQRLEQMFDERVPYWLKDLAIQCYGQWEFEPKVWSKVYQRHLQSVVEYFQTRKSQLLILNICGGEGWQELCAFLGCDVPNVSFPKRNQSPVVNAKRPRIL